jgi:hypothetical protein
MYSCVFPQILTFAYITVTRDFHCQCGTPKWQPTCEKSCGHENKAIAYASYLMSSPLLCISFVALLTSLMARWEVIWPFQKSGYCHCLHQYCENWSFAQSVYVFLYDSFNIQRLFPSPASNRLPLWNKSCFVRLVRGKNCYTKRRAGESSQYIYQPAESGFSCFFCPQFLYLR